MITLAELAPLYLIALAVMFTADHVSNETSVAATIKVGAAWPTYRLNSA